MKLFKKTAFVVSTLAIVSASVYAHQGAEGIVKQRMDSMSEMGDAMKAMADMVKGKSEFNTDIVRDSAEILSRHASKLLDHFPDTDVSRNGKESDALPVIWESWDRFGKKSNNLETAVASLEQASEQELDKRALRLAFTKVAKACSSCHDDFRRPEE